jgi:hypothetical protein
MKWTFNETFKSATRRSSAPLQTAAYAHVPLLAKAIGFTTEEFSTRNKKLYTLL